jgi:hypothetical protein
MQQHDPDFATVLDAISATPETFVAMLRFTAKSGNILAQNQALHYVADLIQKRTLVYSTQVQQEPLCIADMGELSAEDLVFCQQLEDSVADAEDAEQQDEEAKQAAKAPRAPKRDADSMENYLKRATKMRRTFEKFRDKYGAEKAPRSCLNEMMKNDKELIHHSSTNKLFLPPPGFDVAMFARDGTDVYLSPEWLEAWPPGREESADAPPPCLKL